MDAIWETEATVRIGINLLWMLPGVGGSETHVRGLIGGLAAIDPANSYLLFTNRENHGGFEGCGANFARELCDFSAVSRPRRIAWEQTRLPGMAARAGLDVLHSPGYTGSLMARCAQVVTIHDCHPWAIPQSAKGTRRSILKLLTKATARVAEAIVAVSEFSAREIADRLRVARAKIFVVHNAPASRLPVDHSEWPGLARRLGISQNYVMAFSSAAPHKNIDGLIRAFAMVSPSVDRQLVVVGRIPANGQSPGVLARRLGIEKSVLVTGYLTNLQVQTVLDHASALVFPSIYEGFGIPVLEAMNAGVPVVCSDRGALPEVAGSAALYFDPSTPDRIADAIQRIIADEPLRRSLIAAGHENVKKFSWRRAARETLEVYQRVARARTGAAELQNAGELPRAEAAGEPDL